MYGHSLRSATPCQTFSATQFPFGTISRNRIELSLCNFDTYLWCGPPPLSSGQNTWLQIQSPEFDSLRYQIFWEVVGLERGPLSLVNITEELHKWKSSDSGSGKPRLKTAVRFRCADHATPSLRHAD
jgi:hypothetical protein